MGKKTRRTASVAVADDADVPVVGQREPCPCGSGKRYKMCHGRARADTTEVARVARPFAGVAGECDWVAMREVVPAATATATTTGDHGSREIVVATVLPMAWPAMHRADGQVLLGLQTHGGSGDPSRDAADALLRAIDSEPGTPVNTVGLEGPGPRLQDVLDPGAEFRVAVHEGFDFWLEDGTQSDEVRSSMERAHSSVVPTEQLAGVESAYWCHIGARSHLRWVLPHDEEPLLDAIARLHAGGGSSLGEGTRYIGAFRAHGLLVPVWDLPPEFVADDVEEPAAAFGARLAEALADDAPLTVDERRARAGVVSRQLTLR